MTTQYLNLPFIAEGQAQPHVVHNEALALLDGLHSRHVTSATTPAAPDPASEGDGYILPAGHSGFHPDALAGDICIFSGGDWHRVTPLKGWRWTVGDEAGARVYTGADWVRADIVGALGSTLGLQSFEIELPLTGSSVTAAGLIPTRAIILGVSSWTISDISGATSYSVGIAGEVSKFGGALGILAGSSNVGVVGPFATYAPDDVIITASGPDFTGGTVGLSVAAIVPGAPL